jgi:hypothetical protein
VDERELSSVCSPRSSPAGGGADEAARVARRLQRIESLDRQRAPAGELLSELRELVHEAEAWARHNAGAGPPEILEEVHEEVEGMR